MARPPSRSTPKDLAAEGDVNLSARRADWQARHVGAAARALLEEDARYFLHQSLSTPCLTAIKSASGIWLEALDGSASWTSTATACTSSATATRAWSRR